MTTTTRALCATLLPEVGDLWFSTDHPDRARAKAYCATCPLQAGCAQAGLANQKNRGVWGGLDTRDRRRVLGLPLGGTHPDDEESVREPQPPRECGTEEAYQAHRARRQRCTPCTTAHDARVREQRLTALAREHEQGGGTPAGYLLHRRLGETACDACRDARVAATRARRTAQRAAQRAARREAQILQFQAEQRRARAAA